MEIILASTSPRRKELMQWITKDFETFAPEIDESSEGFENYREYVLEMAIRKARVVSKKFPQKMIIASDTVVAHEGNILGKPKTSEEAYSMIQSMSGKTHVVATSVAMIFGKQEKVEVFETQVTFFELTDEEIHAYIRDSSVLDKAGSYGIQEGARLFVKEIHGSFDNVVGFPVAHVKKMLEDFQKNV